MIVELWCTAVKPVQPTLDLASMEGVTVGKTNLVYYGS